MASFKTTANFFYAVALGAALWNAFLLYAGGALVVEAARGRLA